MFNQQLPAYGNYTDRQEVGVPPTWLARAPGGPARPEVVSPAGATGEGQAGDASVRSAGAANASRAAAAMPATSAAVQATPPQSPQDEDRVTSARDDVNSGSMGHPELCSRPCLYFPSGQCANGSDCDFCHMVHNKRPVHLNKRHREALKVMPVAQCLAVMVPVLRTKAQSLRLAPKFTEVLEKLELMSAQPNDRPTKQDAAMHDALKVMSLRSLLTTLHRMVTPANTQDRVAVEACLQSLRLGGGTTADDEENNPVLSARHLLAL
eukprot:TRINITY_DN10575_c2_g2_i1.p1 TRINITY_DN10575_c2_g2~~TRINITY_DN10575_c2_g2_i1.p1  ORF type:complete len:266 (-),score=57.80 TRINITY_DN10575_c2_g2_i1:278-1075(-)